MNHTILRNAFVTLASFILVITAVQAWTAPVQAPPNGNVSAPINVSATAQSKSGGLDVAWLNAVGSIRVGNTGTACNDSTGIQGAIRWTGTAFQGCTSTGWGPFGGGGGDNLGNHTATQNINMAGSQVTNIGAPTNAGDAATKAYVDGKVGGLGVGQTWQDLIGSRSKETEYTNTTGKPIMVNIFVACGAAYGCVDAIKVDGISVSMGYSAAGVTHSELNAIVPAGSKYKFTNIGFSSAAASTWVELR